LRCASTERKAEGTETLPLASILLVAFERKRFMTRNIRSRRDPDQKTPETPDIRHSFASRMSQNPSDASGEEDAFALR
jgi:hypothetical protein